MAIIGISGKIGSGKDTIASIIQYLTTQYNNDYLTDKDTLLITYNQYLKGEYPSMYNTSWKIKKFGGKLKDIVCILLGCTREQLENINYKNSLLPDEWQVFHLYNFDKLVGKAIVGNRIAHFNTEQEAKDFCTHSSNSQAHYTYKKSERTVRWMLQYLGTDLLRDQLHNNTHVNALFSNYIPIGGKMIPPKYPKDYTSGLFEFPNWIIIDVRFPNEVKAIKERGGLLFRVNRHRRFDEHDFYNLVMDRLDNPNPNMDKAAEFAKRLDLGYDESTDEWVDTEDLYRGKEHESETALDAYQGFDEIIDNNGSIDDLVIKVKGVLTKHLNL